MPLPAEAARVRLRRAHGLALTAVGEITAAGLRYVDARARDVAVAAGFEHFAPGAGNGERRA